MRAAFAACMSTAASAAPPALRFLQVNAFADRPFAGNPAAVFLVPPAKNKWTIDDAVMQKIAAEMRLSETAFLMPSDDAGSFESSTRFRLRWFTPTVATALPLARCPHPHAQELSLTLSHACTHAHAHVGLYGHHVVYILMSSSIHIQTHSCAMYQVQ